MNIPRNKRFFEHGDWVEILAETPMKELPDDVRRRFIREAMEDGYRREYYSALDFFNEKGPDWEDLTDEQRENIREEQRQYARDMQALGKALAKDAS